MPTEPMSRVGIIWCRLAVNWSNAISVKGEPVAGLERVGVSEAKYAQLQLKAETEYEVFRIVQDQNYMSDFDRMIAELEK